MKSSTKIGIIVCLAIMMAFSLSLVFAGNEKGNANKTMNMTNATKNMTKAMNMTNATMNMTNTTESFAKTKSYRKDLYL